MSLKIVEMNSQLKPFEDALTKRLEKYFETKTAKRS